MSETTDGTSESSVEFELRMDPSKAQIGISQVTIPLAWNRDEHFKSKGECRTFSMFLSMRCGEEVIESKLITAVDRSVTDISFSDAFIFQNQPDDFCIEVDLFAARTDDFDSASGSIRQRITRSLGRKLGHATKQNLTVGEQALRAALPSAPGTLGSSKYNLLARAQLAITDAGEEPKIHDLKTRAFADLCGPPLYGSFVCRLVVQPHSVLRPVADGVLTVIPAEQKRIYQLVRATLQSGRLRCFVSSTLSPSREDEQCLLEVTLNAGSRVARTNMQDELILNTAASGYGPAKRYYIRTAEETVDAWEKAFDRQISDCVAWGTFAYNTQALTRETMKEPVETFGRTAGKRFYDQITMNGSLPRQYSGSISSSHFPLSSSSFNVKPRESSLGYAMNNYATDPARRTAMLRPSILNVFNERDETAILQSTPITSRAPSPGSHSILSSSSPRPYQSTAVQATSPPCERRSPRMNVMSYSPVYDELPPIATIPTLQTTATTSSVYGTDARKYAQSFEDSSSQSRRPRLYELRGRASTYQGGALRAETENPYETIPEEDENRCSRYVIRLMVGDEEESLTRRHSPSVSSTKSEYMTSTKYRPTPAPRERVKDYAPVMREYDGPPQYRSASRSPLPPIPKPRTLYSLQKSQSERDARFLPGPAVQITRL